MKKIVVILLFTLSSCGIFRGRVVTHTVTRTYVDTVIQIHRDTLIKRDTAYIYDTARIDTPDFSARSYIDTITHTIILTGQAKSVLVPVRLERILTEDRKEPDKPVNNFWQNVLIGVSGTLFLITMILFLITMNKK